MASFISALSLFVFVLISGCFTLPIGDNFFSQTSTPFDFDVTTETSVHERMFSEDATISPIDGMTTEDATREPRMFNEVATDESFTFVPTTERDAREPRMFNEVATDESFTFVPTTERDAREPRMFDDVATDESFTFVPTTERDAREPRMFNEVATEESFTFKPTTERSFHEKREIEDSPSEMTMEATTERDELALHDIPTETFTESSRRRLHSGEFVHPTTEVYRAIQGWSQPSTTVEPRMTESGMHMSFTTNSMPSFPSTSSTIAPEVYTRDSTTTRKYTGLLADKLDHEVESEEDNHEHKKLLGKDKFVEPTHEETKLNKEKVLVVEHEKVHDKVQPEIEEDKYEEITMAPKKYKEIREHERFETKEDKPEKFTKEEPKKTEGKESSEEKKTSHKQEGEVEEEFQPEKFIPKRPTTPRRPQVDSDDNTEYPKALYFDKTWTSVVKIPSDFAILDETTDIVTVANTFRPSKSVASRFDELKLNQGQESARTE